MSTATTADDWSNHATVSIPLAPSLHHSTVNMHSVNMHLSTDDQVIQAMIEESVKIGRCVRAADALECSHWAKRSNVSPYTHRTPCSGSNFHCPDAACRVRGFVTIDGLKKHLDPWHRHKPCPANKHMRHLNGPYKESQQEDVVNLSNRANEITPMQDLTNSVSPSRLAIQYCPVTKSPKKLPTPIRSDVENHEQRGHADDSAQIIPGPPVDGSAQAATSGLALAENPDRASRQGITRAHRTDTVQNQGVGCGKWSMFDPASYEIDTAASREGPMLQFLIAVTLAEAADHIGTIHSPVVTATKNATSTSFASPPAFTASSTGKEALVSSQGRTRLVATRPYPASASSDDDYEPGPSSNKDKCKARKVARPRVRPTVEQIALPVASASTSGPGSAPASSSNDPLYYDALGTLMCKSLAHNLVSGYNWVPHKSFDQPVKHGETKAIFASQLVTAVLAAAPTGKEDPRPCPFISIGCRAISHQDHTLWKRHVKTHGPAESKPTCKWCGMSAARQDSLNRHMKKCPSALQAQREGSQSSS
ncbi:hypothetical protein BKA62DRAFT_670268 [Auriculariales sp. MPI-PUGE-AT-0066]|nr:hypothetical protein BKA62DRAFT_670268 [Auriculariales sp. MPI-PUGE-AT-0066]